MPEQERLASIVFRENLLLLAKACALRWGKSHGSRKFMAAIIETSETHLSDLLKGKKGVTGRYKERIEKVFKLRPNWLDEPHPDMRPSELLKSVPLPEDVLIARKAAAVPTDPEAVVKRILALQQELEQLKAAVAPGRNTPK